MQDVAQMIRRFEPPAPIEIERVPLGSGQDILVLRVSNIAVEAMPFTYDGRPFQRIGRTTSVMPQETYQRQLLERAHARRWENVPSSFMIGDLDADEIQRTRQGAIAAGRLDPLLSGAASIVSDFGPTVGSSTRQSSYLGVDSFRTTRSANFVWHDSAGWTKPSSTISARSMDTLSS
jgi:ATP-dependent DNA helicase RecG